MCELFILLLIDRALNPKKGGSKINARSLRPPAYGAAPPLNVALLEAHPTLWNQ